MGFKVLSEQDTRRNLLSQARERGCEKEILAILNKYDNLLRNCTNKKEKEDISKLGVYEVYKMMDDYTDLYIDGVLVIKGED